MLLLYSALVTHIIDLHGSLELQQVYEVLNSALARNTRSWPSPSLAAAVDDLQLTCAEVAALPISDILRVLQIYGNYSSADHYFPDKLPALYRVTSNIATMTKAQQDDLKGQIRQHFVQLLRERYGVQFKPSRIRPIIFTGPGGATVLEQEPNDNWVETDASFLRFFDEVEHGQHDFFVTYGASTLSSPVTMLRLAQGLREKGVILFVDNVTGPVTVPAPAFASLLGSDLNRLQAEENPRIKTMRQIGRLLYVLGDIATTREEEGTAGSILSMRVGVIWQNFTTRRGSTWYTQKETNDDTRWRSGTLPGEFDVRLSLSEKPLLTA